MNTEFAAGVSRIVASSNYTITSFDPLTEKERKITQFHRHGGAIGFYILAFYTLIGRLPTNATCRKRVAENDTLNGH